MTRRVPTRLIPTLLALIALVAAIVVVEVGLRDPGPGMLVRVPTPALLVEPIEQLRSVPLVRIDDPRAAAVASGVVFGRTDHVAPADEQAFLDSGLWHLLTWYALGHNERWAMQRYVGYIRVSDTRGRSGENFISPDVQRERIAAWAASRDGVSIVDFFTDLDVSGGVLKRPRFDEALALIESGLADGIVVAKLDRFSRAGVADALKLIERIEKLGGHVASVEEGIDPTTPVGEFARTIFLALARMQRQQIADGWKAAQRKAVERGVHVASQSPTGYSRADDGRLKPDPLSAPVIAEVFQMKAAGASWRELSEHMNERGVLSPYGVSSWTPRAIQGIVSNRVYLGEARSGEFVNANAHDPLVDRGTWDAAQVRKLDAVPRGMSEHGALLSGILRCAGCRYVMKPDKMTLRDGSRVRIYRCRSRHASGVCPDRASVMGSVIEPYVAEAFLSAYELEELHPLDESDVGALEAELEAAELELEAFLTTGLASVLGTDRFQEAVQDRAATVEDVKSRLRAHRPIIEGGVSIREAWDEASVSQRRKLISSGIDAVMLFSGRGKAIENRVEVIPAGELPGDFPRRGMRVPLAPYAP